MNEPKLRFKADDGSQFPDWEEKKLNEIAVRVTRKNKDNVTDIPLTISSVDGLIDQRDFFNKVVASKDMSGYYLLKNGEFAYNKSYSKGYDFGSIKRLDLYDEGALSTLYICFALNKNENSDFYQKYFDSLSWYPELQKICAEGARNHGLLNVPTNDFFQLKLCVPSSEQEQQKIAEFLSTIDTVIAKQKETVSAWEERKKGVMQKLFSQEVRFKADDGSDFPEWEEKPYLSICNVFTDGDWIESKDQSDSGIRLIQTGNIGNGMFIDKGDKKKYISKETFDRLKCNEVFEGDILISRLPSPAGRACIVPKLNERIITAVDCTIVRTDKSIISHDYCAQFMQSSKHFYYVASMMAGGTRQRISRRNLEDELISVPCLAEQQKIADCLSSLDDVIGKQKATLVAWEELKKGLLQQMFV